jgi:hypothetical protein
MKRDTIIRGDATSGAEFSHCEKYRYKLWRVWDESLPVLYFILMNPSTADEHDNDPTISRQCVRAKSLGFGAVCILNCGAIRCTDSRKAWADEDPVGPYNLETISEEVRNNPSAMFIAGWGKPAAYFGADRPVVAIFKEMERSLHALAINGDGSPRHPLYIGYNVEPKIMLDK